MNDLFGFEKPTSRPLFKDIRNTCPTIAEEKALLALKLGKLMRKVPGAVQNGSINKNREWVAAVRAAAKVAKSTRSSVSELEHSVQNLERFVIEV